MVIAEGFEEGALESLQKSKNVRLIEVGPMNSGTSPHDSGDNGTGEYGRDIKKIEGGILIQTSNNASVAAEDLKVVTEKAPTDSEIRAMLFANKVVKHVHSNAIVFAKVLRAGEAGAEHASGDIEIVTGIGAGQMSRVDSVFIGAHKGGDKVPGSVMASDAFFPFADGVEACAKAGATAIIQPGGSIRDEEVVAAANKLGLAMVTTGVRLFRH
jgi:phosphoribosylaminoimidazolecarboxamide formyltransferase/IMP cyclohydrolase